MLVSSELIKGIQTSTQRIHELEDEDLIKEWDNIRYHYIRMLEYLYENQSDEIKYWKELFKNATTK